MHIVPIVLDVLEQPDMWRRKTAPDISHFSGVKQAALWLITVYYAHSCRHMNTHSLSHTQGSLLWRKISVCWTGLKWQRGVNCTLSTLLWEKVNVKYLACLYYHEILQLGFPRQLFCWKRFVCAHMLYHVFVSSFKTGFIPNMFHWSNMKCNENALREK